MAFIFATSAEGGILHAFTPVLIMVLASLFLKEATTVLQRISIFLSVSGVILIFVMKGYGIDLSNLAGILLLTASSIAFAGYSVLARSLLKSHRPMEVTYWMLGIGCVFFLGLSLVEHAAAGSFAGLFAPLAESQFVVSVLYLGILSSLVTALTANYALSKLEAAKAGVFANLSTVVSIAAGALILGEKIEVYHIIGSVMIIAGVWGANRRRKTPLSSAARADGADVFAVIRERQAVKHFDTSYSMSEQDIKELLELSSRAPSAWNLQHWKFLVITSRLSKEKLLPIAYGQSQVLEASAVVAVLGDLQANLNAETIYDPIVREGKMSEEEKSALIGNIDQAYAGNSSYPRDEAIRNASLAAMQLMLAAKGKGLDTCPMGGFDADQLVQAFSIPERYIPVMLITVGKAAAPARPSARFSAEQTIVWNGF